MSDWVEDLQRELSEFAVERDWEQYHTPQNLAALIASEAGELLALFRWGQNSVEEQPERVREELADVLLGILRFADVTGIDLESSARSKLEINERNYPGTGEISVDKDAP